MLAGIIPTAKGPYLSLLTTLYNEVTPFSKAENLPEWAGLVMELDHLEKQAKMLRIRKAQSSGVLKKTVSKVKSKIKVISKAGKIKKAMDSETMMEAAETFNRYQDTIVALTPMVSSRRASAKLASAIYAEDPATSDHVFFKTEQAIKKLKRMMGYPGKEPGQIWHLLEGPMNFYHEFSIKEAACYLQKRWERDVLMQFRDVSIDKNRNQVLLGPEGFVTTFVNGPGKPFIKRGLKKGFYSAKVMGRQIPFYKSFFQFLSRGRASAARTVKDSYAVRIKAEPTDTNDDAAVKPEATRLELVCADQTVLLENYNYPKEKVFTWAPESECEVIFSIQFRNLVLTRRYTGKKAFPKFLKSFSRGRVKFLPSDFPEHQDDLKRMGVKFIRVRYQFKGHQSVIRLLHAGPGSVPTEIVQCWD
jgi:type VI secretion system protein ImpL